MKPCKISVITVCFNAASTVERTIESVLRQRDVSVEYIFVDGMSTDGTLAIVDRYRDRLDTVVSERDAGIFDAMNKGIRLSTGDVLYFLGADDTFVDNFVLRDIARCFAEDSSRLLVYGNVVFVQAPPGMSYGPAKAFETFSIREFLDNWFCHQALFARRSLFDDIGLFNAQRRYSADYEWVIKAFRKNPKGFFYLDRLIANYFFLGRSFMQAEVTRREVRGYYFEHLLSFDMIWYYFRYVLLRGWKRKILGHRVVLHHEKAVDGHD